MQEEELLVIYRVQLGQVHREMKKVLEDRETSFEHISLSLQDFNHSGFNGQELMFCGKMYDIKAVTYTGNRVELLAVNDLKEKGILDQISHTINHQRNSRKEMPDNAIQFMGLLYDFPGHDNLFTLSVIHKITYQTCCISCLSRSTDITSPPPEIG